jgi:short-subunit dehydrogenase
VTVVFPGAIGTNISLNSGVNTADIEKAAEAEGKTPKMTSPAEAGRQIVEAFEKGSYRLLIGSDAKFLDYFSRLSPRRASLFIAKQMKALLGG